MIPPYPLEIDTENGIYSFTTSNDIKYLCRFRNANDRLPPLLRVYDIEAFDFDFYPEKVSYGRNNYDEAICITICSIIELFFTSNLRVLLYVCDSLDGRQKERYFLFNRWYYHHSNGELIRMSLNAKIGEDTIYGCALLCSDFPHMYILENEFRKAIVDLTSDK